MNKVKTLEEKWHIDFPEGFRCRFIKSETEKKVLHSHEYYEIFLTLTDNIQHEINGKTELLKKGSLVFIRPGDVHLYKNNFNPYRFINLAFSCELAKSVFAFTETEIPVNELCSCAFPPTIYLSHTECKKVENLFHTINYIPGDKHIEKRLQCKFILINLFSKYFIRFNSSPSDSDIPSWLSGACEQMKSVKNFREGTPAMIKLCGKSYEHISRSIKKYYGITLTEYINTLRLNYAANLLANTNYTLTDIYLECGFNSPSYFSSSFKNYYGLSPYEYRKKL